MPVTIKDIKTILTQPAGSRLIIVKVTTSDDGLYGLGCATFTQRFNAVVTAIEEHLKPFLIGRDVDRIEETWQMSSVNSYWRNGPVLNNAISGVDQALWDIKGKAHGVPVYQLLGGRCRDKIRVYSNGGSFAAPEEAARGARQTMELGFAGVKGNPLESRTWPMDASALEHSVACVEAMRREVGPKFDILLDARGPMLEGGGEALLLASQAAAHACAQADAEALVRTTLAGLQPGYSWRERLEALNQASLEQHKRHLDRRLGPTAELTKHPNHHRLVGLERVTQ